MEYSPCKSTQELALDLNTSQFTICCLLKKDRSEHVFHQWPGRPEFNPMSCHTKDSKKWYLMPPCLTLSIIRYGSRVKWNDTGKGVVPSPTRCSSYWKRKPSVTLNYGRQLYLLTYISIITSFLSRQRNDLFLKKIITGVDKICLLYNVQCKSSGLSRMNLHSPPQRWSFKEDKLCSVYCGIMVVSFILSF